MKYAIVTKIADDMITIMDTYLITICGFTSIEEAKQYITKDEELQGSDETTKDYIKQLQIIGYNNSSELESMVDKISNKDNKDINNNATWNEILTDCKNNISLAFKEPISRKIIKSNMQIIDIKNQIIQVAGDIEVSTELEHYITTRSGLLYINDLYKAQKDVEEMDFEPVGYIGKHITDKVYFKHELKTMIDKYNNKVVLLWED